MMKKSRAAIAMIALTIWGFAIGNKVGIDQLYYPMLSLSVAVGVINYFIKQTN